MAANTEPSELNALTAQGSIEDQSRENLMNASTSIIRDITLRKWEAPILSDKISSDSRSQLMTFLTKYGYDQNSSDDEEDNFIASLKAYQEYGNLPITGKYDEATRSLMSKPRCGHPDLKKNTTAGPNSFVTMGVPWNKMNLTYRIEQFSPDITPAKQRRAIADGFACWAAATPLSFKEVTSGADITLGFITGRYGPKPEHVFDGLGGTAAVGSPSGLIYFDEAELWTENFLRLVVLHEIGHCLGLDHSNVFASAMHPSLITLYAKLHPDDLHAIHSLYGWREPRWMMIDYPRNPLTSLPTESTISMLSTFYGFYKLLQNGNVFQYVGPPGPGFTGWQQIGLNITPPAIELIGEGSVLFTRSKAGMVLRYNNSIYPSWYMIDFNPDCAQLAFGGNEIYQRHFNAAKNYAAIYRYRGDNATPRWELIDDNPRTRQIDVDTRTLFQRHDNGSVWRYVGPGINWTLVSDQANAVAIAVGGETLYWLQPNGAIWWDGRVNPLDRNPETVSIFAKGEYLYQIHKDRSLWRFSGSPIRGWELLDGVSDMVECVGNAEGDVYQRRKSGHIWRLAV